MTTHTFDDALLPIHTINALDDDEAAEARASWHRFELSDSDDAAREHAELLCDHTAALLDAWSWRGESALGDGPADIALAYDTLATRAALARLRPELDPEQPALIQALDALLDAYAEAITTLAPRYIDPTRWLAAAEQWSDDLLEITRWDASHGERARVLFDALDRAELVASTLDACTTATDTPSHLARLDAASALACELPELFLPAEHHIRAAISAQRPPHEQSGALMLTQLKHAAALDAIAAAHLMRARTTTATHDEAPADETMAEVIDLIAILASRRADPPLALPEHRPVAAAAAATDPDSFESSLSWRAPDGQPWHATLLLPSPHEASDEATATLYIEDLATEHIGAVFLGTFYPALDGHLTTTLPLGQLRARQLTWTGPHLVVLSHHNGHLTEHPGIPED